MHATHQSLTRSACVFTCRGYGRAGLFSAAAEFGVNFAWSRKGAFYVDKILKGASPCDLPVEQPNRFDLHINLKTAKALGLTFPQSIFLRADEVVQ